MGMSILLPKTFRAGDTFTLTYPNNAHPSADGWSASLVLLGASKITVPQHSAEDSTYVLKATSTTAWVSGLYAGHLVMAHETKGSTTYDVGQLQILASLASLSTADVKTPAQRILEAIDTCLEGKANEDAKRMELQGQVIEAYGIEELMRLRKYYKNVVTREQGGRSRRFIPVVPRIRP